MSLQSYCLLTGGRCSHTPIVIDINKFFISEPYDEKRDERDKSIINSLGGFPYEIADHKVMNIALTCKICQQIQSSAFGIVDISNRNPNVLIELGMLYGFGKPTIIILEKDAYPEFDVPSNVKGIEQVRYENFEDLTEKLQQCIVTLLKLRNEIVENIIDFEPILDGLISEIETEIKTRKLLNSGFKSQIIDFKTLENLHVLIIDKGFMHGTKEKMILKVFRADKIVHGNYLEEDVGLIIVTFSQEKISQCNVFKIDIEKNFWKDLYLNNIPRNFVKPLPKEIFKKCSMEHLEDLLGKAKILLNYINFGRTK